MTTIFCVLLLRNTARPLPAHRWGGSRLRQNVLLVGGERMNSPHDNGKSRPPKVETALITSGRDTRAQKGFVNPPVIDGLASKMPDISAIAAVAHARGALPIDDNTASFIST